MELDNLSNIFALPNVYLSISQPQKYLGECLCYYSYNCIGFYCV